MKLHLGVVDVPEPAGGTTYTVGKQLEDNYGLFSAFYGFEEKKIASLIEEDIGNAMESYLSGNGFPKSVFGDSTSEIDHLFKNFLSTQEAERVLAPGSENFPVPTKAALEGKSLRLKGGKKIRKVKKGQEYETVTGNRRPSFIDTGIFEASFKSWIE